MDPVDIKTDGYRSLFQGVHVELEFTIVVTKSVASRRGFQVFCLSLLKELLVFLVVGAGVGRAVINDIAFPVVMLREPGPTMRAVNADLIGQGCFYSEGVVTNLAFELTALITVVIDIFMRSNAKRTDTFKGEIAAMIHWLDRFTLISGQLYQIGKSRCLNSRIFFMEDRGFINSEVCIGDRILGFRFLLFGKLFDFFGQIGMKDIEIVQKMIDGTGTILDQIEEIKRIDTGRNGIRDSLGQHERFQLS